MAINLQEIYVSDTDLIKIDKINYNFDQILGQGGGPQGLQGLQGLTGLTGPQGNIGPQGQTGPQGSSGSAANVEERWDSYTVASGYNVIRPLNESNDKISKVILGDIDVGFAVGEEPSYEPVALLSLARTNTGDIENAIEFKSDSSTGSEYIIRNEVGTLLLTSTTGVSGSGFRIDIPNEIRLSGYDVKIESFGDNVSFESSNDIVSFANEDIVFDAGNDIVAESRAGNILFQSLGNSSDIIFQTNGSSANVNLISAADVNISAASGTVQLQSNSQGDLTGIGYDLNLIIGNISTIKANVLNEVDSNTKVSLQIGGDDKFFVESNLNTSTQTIFFENDNTGIMFRDGGSAQSGFSASPNNNTPDSDRTLADYLNLSYDNSITFYQCTGPIGDFNTNLLFDSSHDEGTDHTSIGSLENITNYKNSVSYIKIGDLITVWGTIYGGSTSTWDGNTNQLVLSIEDDALFPYKNGWYDGGSQTYVGQSVLVDISIGGDTATNINNWTTSLDTGADIIGLKGVIAPGSSRMHLFWQIWDPSNTNQVGAFKNIPCQPDHFGYGGTQDQPFSLTFAFSMPSSRKSYQKTAGEWSITAYYQDPSTISQSTGYAITQTVLDDNNNQRGIQATIGTLDNTNIQSQCVGSNITAADGWVPVDITIDVNSAGGDWSFDSTQSTYNSNFYYGTFQNTPTQTGGSNWTGTSIISPIRGINTTGSDITDTLVFKNNGVGGVDTSVTVVHPSVSTYFEFGEPGATVENDTIEGRVTVHRRSQFWTYQTEHVFSTQADIGHEYYEATGVGTNSLVISAEYARPFATVGRKTYSFSSATWSYTPYTADEYFTIYGDIDTASHYDGATLELSDFECTQIEASEAGLHLGNYQFNTLSTTDPADIADAFAGGFEGSYSNCFDGVRDPNVRLRLRGETLNFTTPGSTYPTGIIPSPGPFDGPWSHTDKWIKTYWKHKQDNSVPQKTIQVILKKDPVRAYVNNTKNATNFVETTYINSGSYAMGYVELGRKVSNTGSTTTFGEYQSSSYWKSILIFHEQTGYELAITGFSPGNSSVTWGGFWNDSGFVITPSSSNGPGTGTNNTSEISIKLPQIGWSTPGWGQNQYIDIEISLIPKYDNTPGTRFENIDCGSFSSATASSPAQYQSPSNAPLVSAGASGLGTNWRVITGGEFEANTGVAGSTVAAGTANLRPQRWTKVFTVRCWKGEDQSSWGGKESEIAKGNIVIPSGSGSGGGSGETVLNESQTGSQGDGYN